MNIKITDIGFENFEEDFYANPNTMFIIPNYSQNKTIKIAFVGDTSINIDGDNIEIKRKLSEIEAKKLLIDIFGTDDIGILECNNIKNDS